MSYLTTAQSLPGLVAVWMLDETSGTAVDAGPAAWAASTAYSVVGQNVVNGGDVYALATAGTSAASGGPTGTASGAITDGTAQWSYIGARTAHALTASGPVTQGAAGLVTDGGKAVAFGGSGYLTTAASADFQFGTGDFWVAGVVKTTSAALAVFFGGSVSAGPFIATTAAGKLVYQNDTGTPVAVTSTTPVTTGNAVPFVVTRVAGTTSVYLNGGSTPDATGADAATCNTTTALGVGAFGADGTYPFTGTLDGLLVGKGYSLTGAQAAALMTAATATSTPTPTTPTPTPSPTPTVSVVFVCTSLSYGINGSNPGTPQATRLAATVSGLAAAGVTAVAVNLGIPGQTLAHALTEVGTYDAAYALGLTNVIVVEGPTNSYNAGETAAQAEADLAQLTAALYASHPDRLIVVCTCTPTSASTEPANVQTLVDGYNAYVRSNRLALHAAAVSDVASDSRIGVAGSQNNATYYNQTDETHLTDAGYTIWGGTYDAPAVLAAIAAGPPVPSTISVTPAVMLAGLNQTFSVSGSGLKGSFTFGGTSAVVPTLQLVGTSGYTFRVATPPAGTLTVADASGVSATVSFVAAPPAALTVTSGSGQAVAAWNASLGATSYKLYVNGTFTANVFGGATTYTATGLTNGTPYTVGVSAVDASGHESGQATVAGVVPSVPTVAFGRAADVTPSDTVDLPFRSREIRATFTGTVAVIPVGQTSPVSIPVAAGVPLVFPATRILSTGTTAGGTIAVLS